MCIFLLDYILFLLVFLLSSHNLSLFSPICFFRSLYFCNLSLDSLSKSDVFILEFLIWCLRACFYHLILWLIFKLIFWFEYFTLMQIKICHPFVEWIHHFFYFWPYVFKLCLHESLFTFQVLPLLFDKLLKAIYLSIPLLCLSRRASYFSIFCKWINFC